MPDYDVENAYKIDGSDSAKEFYGGWAATYDPQRVAETYLAHSRDDTPILDIGAGTGLVAEHLKGATVDAFDITPEMLKIAQGKGLYRTLIQGDLLSPLPLPDAAYGAVVSCGTFTHGHVGPACFPELLRVTRKGGLFVCGTVPAVFDSMGFGSTLAILQAAGHITPISYTQIEIYDRDDHSHAGDIMVFRKS